MKALFMSAALFAVLLTTGCEGSRWSHPSTVQFSANSETTAPVAYDTIFVVSPQHEGAKADSGVAQFVVDADGQARYVPDAYRARLSNFATGSVLPVPVSLVKQWPAVAALYGEMADGLLRSLPHQAAQPDGTRRLDISGGPLALDHTIAYVGRPCYLQKPAGAPRPAGSGTSAVASR